MRRETAVRLLAELMGSDLVSASHLVQDFETLARYKYDGYEGYGPGLKFLGSVVRWIAQFAPGERETAAHFAKTRVIFISQPELWHAVELVYPSFIRPAILRHTSTRTDIPSHLVAALAASREFLAVHRATLVLGLSDGARLGLLRRLTPQLRHEQFSLVPDLADSRMDELASSLRLAQASMDVPEDGQFRVVLMVDDFSATGTTLLRNEYGYWDGRLWAVRRHLRRLAARGALSPDADVRVILYVATERAARTLRQQLPEAGLGWQLDVVHTVKDEVRVTPDRDPDLYQLCQRYADGSLIRYVPRATGPLAFGCGGAALPVVLHHNTPDNSISLLWQDRVRPRGERDVLPLFPRAERYP